MWKSSLIFAAPGHEPCHVGGRPREFRASPRRWLRSRRFIHIEWVNSKASEMKARVTVTLKAGILDPQGKAIEGALKSLGVGGVASVRQGKVFDIEIEGADRAGAEAALKNAAEKLLANTVIENYRIELTG
jgi:phosphoribosylformylglycinamidine synthase subunit PurS